MKSASRFNLIAMAIVSAILFQSNNLSASQPPVSSLSTDVQEWVDAYNAALEKYPYICGGIIKWNITQWETSDFVVLTGAEHWNGKTDQDYYEQTVEDWNSLSWSHHASQTISLPKGKYMFSITGRASSEVTSYISVKVGETDAQTVSLPHKGSEGLGVDINGMATTEASATYANNNCGFGWEYRFIEFEVNEENQTVVISVDANSLTLNTWISLLQPTLFADAESDVTKPVDEIVESIVSYSDVDLTTINDSIHPWTIVGNTIQNGNIGVRYSTSVISFTYKSDFKTELSFDWCRYNYSYHDALKLYIDGVNMSSTTNSSYTSKRYYIEPGEHIITFSDSIGNSASTSNTSNIKNLRIKEVKPLETAVLTSESLPLTFSNDDDWPWTIEDGYIQNSNYGNRNTTSSFSTSFSITKPSKFSFWSSTYYYSNGNRYNYTGYQYFSFKINGYTYMGREVGEGTTSVLLEPGEYTVEWCDSTYYDYELITRVSNIELSSDWLDVDVASNAGTLGVEVLYLVDVLTDVELLKVSGTINSTDWTNIKQMTNLIALDLTDAKFDAVPDYAFDGLSRLSNVKLPEGMKTIGEYAFMGTQIFDIDIPSSVTSIGQYAFAGTRVRSVNFKDDSQLQSIGYCAFCECTSLAEFLMPNTVTELRTYRDYVDHECSTFYNCTNLRKIHFSDALHTLEQYVCQGCNNLTEVHLPNNLESIRYNAFSKTWSLRSIEFPKSLNRIDSYAFYQCGVDSVRLPITLSTLEYYCFEDCDNLKYIELPSYIGTYDKNFTYCDAIQKIVCQSATPPAIYEDPFGHGRSKGSITLVVPSFAVVNYKLDTYWYQFGSIVEGDDIDYWRVAGPLSLTNNRRMNGKPDIELYEGGTLNVGGASPMTVGDMTIWMSEGNPSRLLNDCPNMTADSLSSKFYVDANKWYFITPLHDVILSNISHSANASYVFRYYDGDSRANNGTGNSWRNVDGDRLLAGQGYIFHCNSSGWLSFPAEASVHEQVFTTADVTKQLAVHESTAKANKNWNYVGNPYPAYYDIYYMDFTAPITVWTGSTYKAYSIADDNYVLRPMQSFFVQKPDEVDRIIFRKEGRQLSSTVDRASYAQTRGVIDRPRHFFDLAILDDSIADETRIVLNENASAEYEICSDASKFMSMESSVAQIFTLDNNGQQYAINERPSTDGEIRLGYHVGTSGFYTISAIRAEGDIFLIDRQADKCIDLSSQDYTFHSDATAGADTDRFALVLSENGSVTNVKELYDCKDSDAEMMIFNTKGQRLDVGMESLPAGVYVIKVNSIVRKVVVE